MDVIPFVGNSLYKDKNDQQSYQVYFNPQHYSVEEESATLSSTHNGASFLRVLLNPQICGKLVVIMVLILSIMVIKNLI